MTSKDLDSGLLSWRFFRTAEELLGCEHKTRMIAIDIPIGLTERGPRACDVGARRLLGPGRASSVFPAPIRPVLDAKNYDEACRIRLQVEGKKLSRQSWAIVPRIRVVDTMLREDVELRSRVREVHPEVCFYFLNGRKQLNCGKRSEEGRKERLALLEPVFGHWLRDALADRHRLASAPDDVLDAFAALWTSQRIVAGTCQTIPSEPPSDPFGLRMEMVV